MRKIILSIVILAFALLPAFSQNCTQFQKGMKLKNSTNAYVATIQYYPEFKKLKDSKREEKIAEYNKNVMSGAEKPASGGTYDYLINDVSRDSEGERVLIQADISGYKYSTVLACKNDTMYIARNTGPIWAISNGDTTGFSLQGVQVIPNKLRVGDVLNPYEDVSFVLPSKNEITVKWPEFMGYKTSYHTETGLDYDTKSNQWVYGKWEVRKTQAIYEDIDVKGKQILKPQFNSKHYLNAKVVREEEVTIDDKKYSALVIESETWTKYKIEVSYDMEKTDCEAYYNKIMKNAEEKATKKNIKAGIENEKGYTVTYLTEWFVPGIGIVKAEGYDINGFINLISSTHSLK